MRRFWFNSSRIASAADRRSITSEQLGVEEESHDGEEVIRQGQQEGGQVEQEGAERTAQRGDSEPQQGERKTERKAQCSFREPQQGGREGEVPGKWRPVVEAVSATLIRVVRSVASVAAAALLLVALPAPAPATVVVAKDFAALCADADFIFVGTVGAVESRWVDDERQSIETLVTFDDLTWLQGEPRSAITLRFGGGTVDGLHMDIAGVPRFTLGERRVIFAYDGAFVSPIVGFDQGAPRVIDGTDGPRVVESGSSPRLSPAGALRLGAPADGTPVPLDDYLDRVRQELAGGDGGSR